jgi:hypothetical protein
MTELVCPVARCKTELQRTAEGTLADGIVAHLRTVHEIGKAEARSIANRWIKDHRLVDGCLVQHSSRNPNCTHTEDGDGDALEP